MIFIVVGIICFTIWFRRRRRNGSIQEMVGDHDKRFGPLNGSGDSDNDSDPRIDDFEKKRPGTGYGGASVSTIGRPAPTFHRHLHSRPSNSYIDNFERRPSTGYGNVMFSDRNPRRPSTSQGYRSVADRLDRRPSGRSDAIFAARFGSRSPVSHEGALISERFNRRPSTRDHYYADRFSAHLPPPKRSELSFIDRLIRPATSHHEKTFTRRKNRREYYERPQSAGDMLRSNIPTPPLTSKTMKQTRFDVPPSPSTSTHKRSQSAPLQSIQRPRTAPNARDRDDTLPWSPPQFAYSNRPFTPTSGYHLDRLRQQGYSPRPITPLLNIKEYEYRVQSPGFEVHTELWRQQQQQWILDERRTIKAEYERLMRERENDKEHGRQLMLRESQRGRKSPLNFQRDLHKELGI